MDTPKQQVSWLERFPPDIWASFVSYLAGEQLGRLMMTGATLTWQRLKSPTVVKSIKLGEEITSFKSFPKFLNDLPSLRELWLFSCNDDWSHNIGLMIDLIPAGVRKLELEGAWRSCADKIFGGTLKLQEHLPHLEILHLPDLVFSSYSWITNSPQSLTELKLDLWDGTVELPTSLIHFEAHTVQVPKGSLAKLPPSLESFVPIQLFGVELVLPLLPPSILKLSLGQFMLCSDRSLVHNLDELPNSLTELQIPFTTDLNSIPDLIFLLPATLTSLDIGLTIPFSLWSHFPRNLTQLHFRAPAFMDLAASVNVKHGKTIPFDVLPRAIRRLRVNFPTDPQYFCSPLKVADHSFFPPQITRLSIPAIQLSAETAKLVPTSLTFLEIGNFCERVCEHLPNSLKSLTSSKTLLSPKLIKFLPKFLTDLRLSTAPPNKPWYDSYTGKRTAKASKLAEYSIHQNCFSDSCDLKDFSPLPLTLTSFNLDGAYKIGDLFLQHMYLPNLLELSLQSARYVTDNSIPRLPSHLTALNLCTSSQISGRSFAVLPKYLTYLNLSDSESIFDSDIQLLPRTLKRAILVHAIHLTNLCILDLPPSLEMLDMARNQKITTSTIPDFPPPLRSYQWHSKAVFNSWSMIRGQVCSRTIASPLE